MQKLLKISTFLFAFGMITFVACQKSETSTPTTPKVSTFDALNTFAKLVADDFRSTGTLKQQQVALYAKTHDEQFNIVDLRDGTLEQRTPSSITSLIASNPLMQITYPSFAFQTDQSFAEYINNIQYYVVLDIAVDLDAVTTLPAYDASGNATTISTTFDETIKYAVIKIDEAHDAIRANETLTVKGNPIPMSIGTFTPSRVEGTIKFYDEATIMNAESKDRGPIEAGFATERTGDPGGPCGKNRPGKDYLYKVLFSNKSAVKVIENGFHLPHVELFATYIFGAVNPNNGAVTILNIVKMVDKHWWDLTASNINNLTTSWNNTPDLDLDVRFWDGLDTNEWLVVWVERDYPPGTTSSWTFGITPEFTVNKKFKISTPITYSWKKSKDDKLCGQNIMDYCDPAIGEGTAYKVYAGGNGGMWFREHVK